MDFTTSEVPGGSEIPEYHQGYPEGSKKVKSSSTRI
jgi:hypothetical protein